MKDKEFITYILYSQIMVYEKDCKNPGLQWTDDHVKQGFAYTEKSVAFWIPDHDWECLVKVQEVERDIKIDENILWWISVPFFVATWSLAISTVMWEELFFEINKWQYQLIFTWEYDQSREKAFILNFYFLRKNAGDFKILKSCSIEGASTIDTILLTTSKEA